MAMGAFMPLVAGVGEKDLGDYFFVSYPYRKGAAGFLQTEPNELFAPLIGEFYAGHYSGASITPREALTGTEVVTLSRIGDADFTFNPEYVPGPPTWDPKPKGLFSVFSASNLAEPVHDVEFLWTQTGKQSSSQFYFMMSYNSSFYTGGTLASALTGVPAVGSSDPIQYYIRVGFPKDILLIT